jgi:3-methyl-2-oxobutanoate hydroxymethyltransferase
MTIQKWWAKYRAQQPITLLTAYDATMARLIEMAEADGVLVGDSLMHTFFGESSTVSMQLADMLYHTRAVKNGVSHTMIIADMPFMTYGISVEDTLRNAAALIQAGATAVKCEVRANHVPMIARLIQEGIPVMGHIGVQPQYIHEAGGYSLKGGSESEAAALMALARQLSDVGVFAVVLEKVPMDVSREIRDAIHCPTIGIGAGPHCSGQVLVTQDVLGLTPNFSPKFVKKYMDGTHQIVSALKAFKQDVDTRVFPTEANGYTR